MLRRDSVHSPSSQGTVSVMSGETHLLAWHQVTCGCRLDADPAFFHVCEKHFQVDKLLNAVHLALTQSLDQTTREYLTSVLARIDG